LQDGKLSYKESTTLPLFEIALALVRFDHVAGFVEHTDDYRV
jgi:hypothetical protein